MPVIRAMRIAYGVNKKEKQFDGLNISPDMFALDSPQTLEDERAVLLGWLREYQRRKTPNLTVVIIDSGDLGKGAGAAKFRKLIEETGAIIEGPNDRVSTKKLGRPESPTLTPEEEKKYCKLWNDGLFTNNTLIARILKETGKQVDRDQMNYICKRKPKRKKQSTKSADKKPK